MAEKVAQIKEWTLLYPFEDTQGEPITCDQVNCALGSYMLQSNGSGELRGPACTTCEFTGDIGDVFNPEEPRFESGAPDNFKLGAARVAIEQESPIIDIIRFGRPKTAEMIEAIYTIRSAPSV